eukprot:scaffold84563_cov72-Phaeocystis_antarctica.AAC.4
MLHGARLRAATAGTSLTVVLVTPDGIDTAAMHRVETFGFQPNRLVTVGTAGHPYGNKEDVAVVVVCPSLAAFDEMGFIPGMHEPVLINPSDGDCAAAEAFGHAVLFDDAVVPRSLARVGRAEARVNVAVQACAARLPAALRAALTMTANMLHWFLLEKNLSVFGCYLFACRVSPELILTIGQVFALTHFPACYAYKIIVSRPRPFWLADGHGKPIVDYLCPRDNSVTDSSFTSGHTAFSTTIAVAATFSGATTQFCVTAATLAVLTAAARVYVGAHYLSDVITGAVLATALNAVCFGANLLPRQGHTTSHLLRVGPDDLPRQWAVTACVVAVNATAVGLALFVARVPPPLQRKRWTKTYQTQLARVGLTSSAPLAIGTISLNRILAPFFAVCLVVFWVPSALAKIYTENRWRSYDRNGLETFVAILLCTASIVLFFFASKHLLARRMSSWLQFVTSTLMYSSLFVFNAIAVDAIIFKSFHNDLTHR